MVRLLSSVRMAPRPVYTPRPGTASTTLTPAGNRPDFQTLLNKQPTSGSTTAAPVTAPPSPSGTIGSIMLGAPGPSANPTYSEPPMAPTAQSLFGANPWITDPGGKGENGSYGYNKYYFATPETAAKVAQMLGGKVVEMNAMTPYGPFKQNQPNEMVQMPDGRLINAGIIASYYDHGWAQQTVDALVKGEVAGAINT